MYDTKQTIEQVTDFAKKATALGFYKQYRVSAELGHAIVAWFRESFSGVFRNKNSNVYNKNVTCQLRK